MEGIIFFLGGAKMYVYGVSYFWYEYNANYKLNKNDN